MPGSTLGAEDASVDAGVGDRVGVGAEALPDVS